jgi:hypothetical protein
LTYYFDAITLHKITKEVSKLQEEKDLEINKYFALLD